MSDKTNPETPVVAVVPETEQTLEVTEEKPNLARRSWNFVKAHKKPAIAGAALLGLVGVAALTGRGEKQTSDTTDPLVLDYDPETDAFVSPEQSEDTTVA